MAESQGHQWSEVTSLGSRARRLPLVCFLLDKETKLTSIFQAGSQTGIILRFQWKIFGFFGKNEIFYMKISILWKWHF